MRLNDSYSSAPLLQRRQDPLKGFSKAPDGVVTIPIFVYVLRFLFFQSQILGCSHGKPRSDPGAFLLGFGCDCGATHDRCWLMAKWWFNHQERRISPNDWGDVNQWWLSQWWLSFEKLGWQMVGQTVLFFSSLSWFYQPIRQLLQLPSDPCPSDTSLMAWRFQSSNSLKDHKDLSLQKWEWTGGKLWQC